MELPRAKAFQGKIVAIMNPRSGKRDGDRTRAALEAFLSAGGRNGELRLVSKGKDVADLAREAVEDGATTVIAAGGDGTISAVAEALAGSGAALGVIPAGTFNYFARGLGIPEEIDGALDVIANGRVRPAGFGRINGRIFLNNASIGIYAVIRRQREQIYRRFGRSRVAAYWSVLRAMMRLYRRMKVTLTVDGETHERRTALVFVANSAYQIDEFGLAGAQEVRKGDLAVYVSRDNGRLDIMKQALRLVLTGMQKGRDFDLFTGRDIVIQTGRPYKQVVRDGEIARMKSPFRVLREDHTLDVIVPDTETTE